MSDTQRRLFDEVLAERASHAARGYDSHHDSNHGLDHLHHWAEHYASLGTRAGIIKAASLLLAAADLREGEALGETRDVPEIVCLCGSTRFYDAFQQANYALTMAGKIVLSVGFYPHAKAQHGHGEGVGHDSAEKVALDELHLRKIDIADSVLVLNVGGYIGESTRREIAYAERTGKLVHYLEAGVAR